MTRVGYYGGSFDPPHRGHLAVALAAAKAFKLEAVQMIPTGRQPLKAGDAHASYADRFAMTALLCEESPDLLHASAIDAPHTDGSPNYTVDWLRAVTGVTPFVIVGADSFLQLRSWRASEDLLRLAEWIVVSRPGFSLADLSALQLEPEEKLRVHLLETVHVEVSATTVRTALAAGEHPRMALTPAIDDYIRQHGLYRA